MRHRNPVESICQTAHMVTSFLRVNSNQSNTEIINTGKQFVTIQQNNFKPGRFLYLVSRALTTGPCMNSNIIDTYNILIVQSTLIDLTQPVTNRSILNKSFCAFL